MERRIIDLGWNRAALAKRPIASFSRLSVSGRSTVHAFHYAFWRWFNLSVRLFFLASDLSVLNTTAGFTNVSVLRYVYR